MRRVVFLSFLVSLSHCWWQAGHMSTAYIAFSMLSDKAKSRLGKVIATFRPLYPKDFEKVFTAAVWPDSLKAVAFNGLNDWHFVDNPLIAAGFNGTGIVPEPDGKVDILRGLKNVVDSLNSTSADPFTRAFSLAYLLHLTGDVHQPLHCVARWSAAFPKGDQGGNRVKIVLSPPLTSIAQELHGYWDNLASLFSDGANTDLYSAAGETYIGSIATKVTTAYPVDKFMPDLLQVWDPVAWSQESFSAARDIAYANMTNDQTVQYITPEYQRTAQQVVLMRLAMGGYRLGYMLEALFGSDTGPESDPPSAPDAPTVTKQDKAAIWVLTVFLVFSIAGMVFLAFLLKQEKLKNSLKISEKSPLVH